MFLFRPNGVEIAHYHRKYYQKYLNVTEDDPSVLYHKKSHDQIHIWINLSIWKKRTIILEFQMRRSYRMVGSMIKNLGFESIKRNLVKNHK